MFRPPTSVDGAPPHPITQAPDRPATNCTSATLHSWVSNRPTFNRVESHGIAGCHHSSHASLPSSDSVGLA